VDEEQTVEFLLDEVGAARAQHQPLARQGLLDLGEDAFDIPYTMPLIN
jgi:hypothetical protein